MKANSVELEYTRQVEPTNLDSANTITHACMHTSLTGQPLLNNNIYI